MERVPVCLVLMDHFVKISSFRYVLPACWLSCSLLVSVYFFFLPFVFCSSTIADSLWLFQIDTVTYFHYELFYNCFIHMQISGETEAIFLEDALFWMNFDLFVASAVVLSGCSLILAFSACVVVSARKNWNVLMWLNFTRTFILKKIVSFESWV